MTRLDSIESNVVDLHALQRRWDVEARTISSYTPPARTPRRIDPVAVACCVWIVAFTALGIVINVFPWIVE